nr:PREDICTED: VIP peptides-like [Rhinolophus sinicus]
METRRKPQLLVHLTLFSVLFSQMLAWPLLETPFLKKPFEGANELDPALLTPDTDILPNAFAGNDRNARRAEEMLTSEYKRLLGQLPAKRHVESFIGKRDSDDISGDETTIPPSDENASEELALKRLFESLGVRLLTGQRETEVYQIEDMKEQSPECFQVNHLSNLKDGQDGRKELPEQDEEFRFGHFKADAE